jgi:predicted PurR-regulated permease PerM
MDEAARPAPTDGPGGPAASSDATSPAGPPLDRRLRPPTLRVALLIGAGIVLATILYLGRSALGPFILGLFLVYLLDPAVTFLQRRGRLPRWVAIFAVYAAIVVGLVLVIRLTLPPLIEQLSRLIAQLPVLLQLWIAGLEEAIAGLELLPESVRRELIETLERFSESITSGEAGSSIGDFLDPLQLFAFAGPLARVVTAFFAYLVIPIFVFYLLKDRAALVEAAKRAMPDEWEPDARSIATIVDQVFARWLRGQLLLGLVVGVATFIGLMILGFFISPVFSDFAVLLAIIAGLLELVPIIGPIISAIPMVLIGATVSLEAALAAFLLALLIQQAENNLLVPKIQGDATDLHPAIVIAGIVIGGSIGGILGAILALPVTAAFRDVVRYLFRRLDPVPMAVEPALADALRPAVWRTIPAPTVAGDAAPASPAAPAGTPAPGRSDTAPAVRTSESDGA